MEIRDLRIIPKDVRLTSKDEATIYQDFTHYLYAYYPDFFENLEMAKLTISQSEVYGYKTEFDFWADKKGHVHFESYGKELRYTIIRLRKEIERDVKKY